jgi:hypothetical protein
MLIQGPLALDWGRRKWGLFPRLENGELSGVNPPTAHRSDLWMRQSIHVGGMPEWVFVKVHTHGLTESNSRLFTAGDMAAAFKGLAVRAGQTGCCVHFASARELFNMIRAAEDGNRGNPDDFRDYVVSKPPLLVL